MLKHKYIYNAARALEIVVGVYFIASAIPKGLDIEKFAVQVAAYKVIQSPNALLLTALFTLFAEIGLGVAMVVGLRLKGLVIVATQGMLLFFTVLIVYAWRVHGLEDCGCFPIFKMSPPVSLFKNACILLASGYMIWALVWRSEPATERQEEQLLHDSKRKPLIAGTLIKIVCAGILASAATTYAFFDIEWQPSSPNEDDPSGVSYAQFEIYIPEGYFNLGTGLYLVPVMSMSCSECMEKVSEINELWFMPDIPPIIALCYEDEPGDMDAFKGYTQPMFPMYSFGSRIMLYYSLIAEEPFRLSLVHDGRLVTAWDGYVPSYEEITEAVENLYAM